MIRSASTLVLLCAAAVFASAQSTVLRVEVTTHGPQSVTAQTDAAVRAFARRAAALSAPFRHLLAKAHRYDARIPFSLPVSVQPVVDGREAFAGPPPSGGDIVLAFDASGARAFSANYKAFLQAVYTAAKPTMDLVFGTASQGGTVYVRNYDTNIGDREAIAGGYYLQNNGSNQREIRFPIYQDPDAAAVNLIHCILLAYLANTSYAFDAYQEGLVRGATIAIARTPGAMASGTTSDGIEDVLLNTYDRSENYDWLNQRPLGGKKFIAANLAGTALPPSGGAGLFLDRYAMAGTIWAKLMVEYPNFVAAFNAATYAKPSIGQSSSALLTLGQSVIGVQRPASPIIEGMSFAEWAKRQFILETNTTAGSKLFIDAIPVTSGLGTGDFGVYIFDATWFKTAANGDETMLTNTAFPIFWDVNFNRIFPSAQDNEIDIADGDGSVEPNFPDNGSGPYRVMVDVPVQDQIARVAVPAGSIATGANGTVNDFYGTVENADFGSADTLVVKLWVNGQPVAQTFTVNDGAFGGTLGGTQGFDGAVNCLIRVYKKNSQGSTAIYARYVDKLPGALGLRLIVAGEGTYSVPASLAAGIQTVGFSVDPFFSREEDVLGLPTIQLQVARYNPTTGAYDLNPDVEPFKLGHGYFVRLAKAISPFMIEGRTTIMPYSVALKSGWNMVSTPFLTAVPTTQVMLEHTTDFPITYTAGVGTLIGTMFFAFAPGEKDANSGLPEDGTMTPATSFQPGTSYFVRNLSADVVVMTFSPTSAGRGFNGNSGGQAKKTGPIAWRLDLVVTDHTHSTFVEVGESATATVAFDPAEDSALPTGIGGLQATMIGSPAAFRDMRPTGTQQVYDFRVDGLKVGRLYDVRFELELGSISSFYFYDGNLHYRAMFEPGQHYTFRAVATSETFSLRSLGRR